MVMKDSTLLLYFKKYLAFVLFFVGGLVLIIALSRFLPEILGLNREVSRLSTKNQELESTLSSILGYAGGAQAAQIEVVDTALPSDKDASLIYASLTKAAADYAVTIDSFSVDVGEVYVSDSSTKGRDDTVSELTVILDVTSPSTGNTLQFVQALYRSLPITQIDTMRLIDGRGQITLTFYYKGETGSVVGGEIQPMSSSEKSVFDQISTWTRP